MRKKREIRYRRTRHSDLVPAMRMIIKSLNQLRRRTGHSLIRMRPNRVSDLAEHWFRTDAAGTFVALNHKDEIVGFVNALVREREWYLANLFVHPAYQSDGIGSRLLVKSMCYGEENNCRRYALCTFSSNEQAVAVYSKFGMVAQRPILQMKRNLEGDRKPPELVSPVNLSLRPLSGEPEINRLTRLDRRARKTGRPEEHLFWFNSSKHETYLFYAGRKFAGYSVVNTLGRIGPIAATSSQYLDPILRLTLKQSSAGEPKQQEIFVPAEKTTTMQLLLSAGFHIEEVLLEMATEKLADLSIYNPGDLGHY